MGAEALLQLAAFMLGVSMAYIAELAEDAIIEAANGHLPDASVATRGCGYAAGPARGSREPPLPPPGQAGSYDGWHATTARAAIQDVPGVQCAHGILLVTT